MKKKEQKARQFVRVVLVVGFLGVFGLGAVWLRHLGTFGVQKIEVADKTAVCDYTNAQATSDYTFDINSIPVVNLQIDVAKDAIVEEYIEGLTVNISDSLPKNNYSELTGKLKARGNSSYSAGKKYGALPYKIKLDETVDLFGFGENAEWLLLPNFIDPTYSRQFLGFYISQLIMGEDYFQPDAKYVEVYLNGEYQGLYLLAESIEENENRLNVAACYEPEAPNTPFVTEVTFNEGYTVQEGREDMRFTVNDTATYYFWPDYQRKLTTNVIYTLKYPEKFSNVSKIQAKYIKNTMNNLHENIKAGVDLEELGIDVQSFANYFLANELLYIADFGTTSTYYYSDGDTVFAGPLWDFDMMSSYDPPDGFLQPETYAKPDNPLYRGLLKYPEFKEALARRLGEVYPELVEAVRGKIDDMKNNELLENAVNKHENLYRRNSRMDVREEFYSQNPTINNINSFAGHLEYLQGWLLDGLDIDGTWHEGRLEWLKNHIKELGNE